VIALAFQRALALFAALTQARLDPLDERVDQRRFQLGSSSLRASIAACSSSRRTTSLMPRILPDTLGTS
jgi:hypothetical protein